MIGDRAYNMILTERTFGQQTHNYVLLGLENGTTWNLLGGKKEQGDKSRGVTAARELFEESAMQFDKRGDINYWSRLPSYEWGKHKVFIHDPKNLTVRVADLNKAAKNVLNSNLPHDYKEMHRYQLIKLNDLIALAQAQVNNGQDGYYAHPNEKNMMIDGWLLFTLKNADLNALRQYR